MKLTSEQQEAKAKNQAKNLQNQVDAVFRRTNEGSFKTAQRYKAANERFCDFLGENTNLKNFRNVEVRHVRAYVEHLQSLDCLPSYILTELSGIKWVHKRMNPKRNLPKSNKCFCLDILKHSVVHNLQSAKNNFFERLDTLLTLCHTGSIILLWKHEDNNGKYRTPKSEHSRWRLLSVRVKDFM